MAHHHHDRETVVERDSSTGLIVGIVVALLVLFLIWAIFFSGWVMDRDVDDNGTTNIEQREEGDTDIDIVDPDEDTTTDEDGTTEPSP